MKNCWLNRFYTLVCFLLGSSFLSSVEAQTGWQWGIGARVGGMESYLVTTDNSGNVIASGYSMDGLIKVFGKDTIYNPAGYQQGILTKIDTAGNFLWAKGMINQNDAFFNSIATDATGNIYVIGDYTDSCTLDTLTVRDPDGVFLAKYSPSGKVLWVENIVAEDGETDDGYVGIDDSGFVYVTGSFLGRKAIIGTDTLINSDVSRLSSQEAFIARFDSLGNPLWAKSFGNVGDDIPAAIAVTKSGNFYVQGNFAEDSFAVGGFKVRGSSAWHSDMATWGNNFFIKFNSMGNVIWARELSYHFWTGIGQSLTTDAAENVYLTGGVDSTVNLGSVTLLTAGGQDAFLAKFDSSGNVRWAKTCGGNQSESGSSVSVDHCGKVWMSGDFFFTDDLPYEYIMNFGADTLGLYWSPGINDPCFLAEYDTAGNYVTSLKLISGGDDFNAMVVNNRGSFFFSGDYQGAPLIFGPDTLADLGEEYFFASKYTYDLSCACYNNYVPVVPDFTSTGDSVVTFMYTGTTSYDSIKWDFGDGTYSRVVNPVHTYTASGIYYVCVSVYSPCAVDGDYSNYCHYDTVTLAGNSIEQIPGVADIRSVIVSPNPATNKITITASEPITEVSISNMLGQCVFLEHYNSKEVEVSLSGLPDGVYMVRLNRDKLVRIVRQGSMQ